MEVKVTPVRTGSKYTSFTEVLGKKLHNKKGVIYPSYTDNISGKNLTMPTRANMSKISSTLIKLRREEFSSYKGPTYQYREWYKDTYNIKRDNWTKYPIHHIIPLEYNGKNYFSNFLVMKSSSHTIVTRWWTGY